MAGRGSQNKLLGLNTKDDRIVPLKSVWIDIHITGYVAEVASTLTYYNEENDPIEATFTFPVDDGSAVFQFEAEIQGRHIKAEIQEKEQAIQTYRDARDNRKTAMLLKEDNSTGDIFSCMLGNLPPKCEATLVMKYVLELPQEPDGKISFILPTVLNPRYSPDVGSTVSAEGATYVPPNRIPYEFKMDATIQGYYKIVSVTSEKCMLDVKIEKDRHIAKVCLGEIFKFDHDLQFLVQYEEPFAPQLVLERGNSQAAGLLKEDILMVSFHPDLEQVTMGTGGEYIFLIDRSGSMDGSKIQNAKQALLLFLKSLPTDCYFNIVSFGSNFTLLFSESKRYSQQNLEEAIKGIEGMAADMGGTEIYPALKEVFGMNFIPKYDRSVFILTDGEVSNTNSVLALVGEQSEKTQSTRVYSLGIGDGASTALVNGIARNGNGKADFVRSGERIQAKVMSLLKCATQPAVTNLSLSWDLPKDVTPICIPTEYPTLISAGERLTVFAILQSVSKSLSVDISGAFTLRGERCGIPVKYTMKFTSSETNQINLSAPVHRLATKTQIKILEGELSFRLTATDERTARQKIIDLSLHGNVVSKFTAFVAIDAEGKKVYGQPVQRQCPVPHYRSTELMMQWHTMPFDSPPTQKQSSLGDSLNNDDNEVWSEPEVSYDDGDTSQIEEDEEEYFKPAFNTISIPAGPATLKQADKGLVRPKVTARTEHSPTDDNMLLVISKQKIEGFWEVSTHLLKLLDVTPKDLNNLGFTKDTEVVCTVVVLCWLRKHLLHRQEEWQMIEAKAMSWLSAKSLDTPVDDLIKKTTSALWP